MRSFTERLIGAASLDGAVYEELEADPGATGQAMGVVLLSSAAAGVGAAGQGFPHLLASMLFALVGWGAWALVIYVVGTRVLPEPQTRSDPGELLRTTGFAAAPGLIRILGVLPLVGGMVGLVAAVWMLVAMVVAVRQALDFQSTARAVAVCVLGFVVYLIVVALPMSLLRMVAG